MSSCKDQYLTHKNTSGISLPSNPVFPKIEHKKMSLSLLKKLREGSMTVEAALAMPLFLFFVANLLSLFIMYESYSEKLANLMQNGRYQAMIAHSVQGTDDMVDLYWIQKISPLYDRIGFHNSYIKLSAHVRKWTGYDVSTSLSVKEEEEYVYITESGTVYHRSRDCSHLKVTIRIEDMKSLKTERNAYGQKYRPCEKCAGGRGTGLVFVTDHGDRYHNSASCSGLKRTILTVPLSQVGGRGPCSVCGSSH